MLPSLIGTNFGLQVALNAVSSRKHLCCIEIGYIMSSHACSFVWFYFVFRACCTRVDSRVLFTWIIWSENDGWSDIFEGGMFLNTIDLTYQKIGKNREPWLRGYQAATKILIGEALVLILVAANACRNTSLEGLNPLLWGFTTNDGQLDPSWGLGKAPSIVRYWAFASRFLLYFLSVGLIEWLLNGWEMCLRWWWWWCWWERYILRIQFTRLDCWVNIFSVEVKYFDSPPWDLHD